MKTASSDAISQILEILIAPPPLVVCREWRLGLREVYTGLRIVKRSSSCAGCRSERKRMPPRRARARDRPSRDARGRGPSRETPCQCSLTHAPPQADPVNPEKNAYCGLPGGVICV